MAFPRVESQPEWQDVLAMRNRFDPLATCVPPHLTLVFPFEDPISDDELNELVVSAAIDSRIFSIVFREITAHEGEYLFLNVKRGCDALIRLRDAIYAGGLEAHRVRTHTFVPHVTLGRLPTGDLEAALDATADLANVTIHALVCGVSVYRIEPDGERSVLFEVPLPATRGRSS